MADVDEADQWAAAGIVVGAIGPDVGCGPGAKSAVVAEVVGPAGRIRMAYVFYESGLSINRDVRPRGREEACGRVQAVRGHGGSREPPSRFKFARQKSKLAGTIRGCYFVIKAEH